MMGNDFGNARNLSMRRSGGKRTFRVPVPDADDVPKEIAMYGSCTWRSTDMSLLDYLRRTNGSGEIARWLRVAHKKAIDQGTTTSGLEKFACEYKMYGEQLVAADMLSWRSDRHCGQWLVLHVPFRQLSEFVDADVAAKVPPEHKYLGMALQCVHAIAQRFWRNPESVRDAMRREGRSRRFVEDVVCQLTADIALVDGYLSGRLQKVVQTSGPGAHPVRSLPIQPRWEEAIQIGRAHV